MLVFTATARAPIRFLWMRRGLPPRATVPKLDSVGPGQSTLIFKLLPAVSSASASVNDCTNALLA